MKVYKKYYFMRLALCVLMGILIGIGFLVGKDYADEVFQILLIAVGLVTVVLNLPPFFFSLLHMRERGAAKWINLSLSAVAILLGVLLMMPWNLLWLLLLVGVFSVVMPVVRIILVAGRRGSVKREIPKLLFGIFIIFVFVTEGAKTLIFDVGAIAAFVLTGLFLVYQLATLKLRFAAVAEQIREEEEARALEKEQ